MIPNSITMAFNLRGLYGPEVDVACKAVEPEVDQWEAGERYPSWEQLCAVAELTRFPVHYFTMDHPEPIPLWNTSLWFTMSNPEREVTIKEWHPVMRYPRAVLDARPESPAEMPN